MLKWQTKEQLTQLLCELIEIPSITGSEGEKEVPPFIAAQLERLPYFQQHPEHLQVHPTKDGRSYITALVRSDPNVRDTIVLLSHFDVVGVEDYADWKPDAFNPQSLTDKLLAQKDRLPDEVQRGIKDGDWLFGRGVMDMKCGLTLHMSMIERACYGEFDGNLLLLSVPDEEVGSVGMRAAVPTLLEIADRYGLDYKMVLNSEPMFSRHPGDSSLYIYKGTIGKVLPGFLCYGKETHVGEPLAGLNGNYMASRITCEIELDPSFCETVGSEVTPPPTNLIQHGLKKNYSAQTPHRAVTMFNLFLFERTAEQLVEPLISAAKRASLQMEEDYRTRAKYFLEQGMQTIPELEIRIMTYKELHQYASRVYGKDKVEMIIEAVERECREELDEREFTIALVDGLAALCHELAPMIVLFFAPPYYPAVTWKNDLFTGKVVEEIISYAHQHHQIDLADQNFFAAISDLSYVGMPNQSSSHRAFADLMPLWERGYSIPLKELERFVVPVLNLGPIGRDAHKWTERLELNYAFGTLVDLLKTCIRSIFTASELTESGQRSSHSSYHGEVEQIGG
ncbi:arginine utilization protein RocB [Paenibacillus forsythiae]|uniref:Arginine utilization protein RocB n=1 Tax=Paenibacillus forsythiae TaxID=365616 RepID=A0ABU3H2B1_9BACL|nr:M20/M25/M40 family metallo-hydrolase [Paenibacillus forsythiae]MDT3424954.1 arginine utilization protein RocB [Paenibacillus forsythiae]